MTGRVGLDPVAGLVAPVLAVLAVLLGSAVTGTSPTVSVTIAVVAVVAVVLVAHVGVERTGLGLLTVGVAASPWNAVSIGPLKLSHAALLAAAVVLGAAAIADGRPVRVPPWVWVLAGSIVVIVLTTLVWPPSTAYFAPRVINGLPDNVAALVPDLGRASMVNGLQWLVAALALPALVCLVAVRRPSVPALLADAFAAGAAVGALVAVSDRLGVTSITVQLTAVDYVMSGRQAGLSVHPNHLALGLAMAIPFVVWRLARARSTRAALLPAVEGCLIAAGLATTGSRAGVVGAALVALVCVLVEPRARRALPALAALAIVGGLVVVGLDPSLVTSVGEALRLSDSASAATSDTLRVGLAEQAVDDFAHSPLHGIGFASMLQAHNIYLQLLAAGGVLLLLGFLAAQAGFLRSAWIASDPASGLGRIVAVAGGSFLVIGVVGNQLPDVFVSVPFALAAGLWAARPTVDAGFPSEALEREDISS